jgi:hypothetical protein
MVDPVQGYDHRSMHQKAADTPQNSLPLLNSLANSLAKGLALQTKKALLYNQRQTRVQKVTKQSQYHQQAMSRKRCIMVPCATNPCIQSCTVQQRVSQKRQQLLCRDVG